MKPESSHSHIRTRLAFAGALSLGLLGVAHADGKHTQPREVLPAYQQECESCHLAYPTRMLPASSWHRIMGGLDQHYGSDASLDAPTAEIGRPASLAFSAAVGIPCSRQ